MDKPPTENSQPLIETRGAAKFFPVRRPMGGAREWIRAVDGVSLAIQPRETLAVVGESGCGKTTLGRLMAGLLASDGGEVVFDGRPLADWLARDPRGLRRRIQMIFQDPLDALDPRWTIAQSVAEPLGLVAGLSAAERRERVRRVLAEVQLPPDAPSAYPHELSGGMRQRAGIARAVIADPAFIVCDEAVSSLDVSVRAQILALLRNLQHERGLTMAFITHDLSVVKAISRRVAVMYLGRVVEIAPTDAFMREPWHPYSEALLAAVPKPDPERLMAEPPVRGEPPSPRTIPSGCRFRTRCPLAQPKCESEEPALIEKAPERFVACHFRP